MSYQRPSRPIVRYHGGKFRLAPRIVAHFPPHRIRVDAYAGAASVTLAAPPPPGAEVVSDLSDEMVNLFRVLRDPSQAEDLRRRCELTPFARSEFLATYEAAGDAVERARRTVFRSFAGYSTGSVSRHYRTGFRSNSNRSNTVPAQDWANWPAVVPALTARLRGVVIECRPALEVIAGHDGPDTLFYLDPPYVHETRRRAVAWDPCYEHEMSDTDHRALLDVLTGGLRGMVVLSGYRSRLYEDALTSWRRIDLDALADGARPRTECLWLNPAAVAAGASEWLPLDLREAKA